MPSAARLLSNPNRAAPTGERLDLARRAVEGRFLQVGAVLGDAVDALGRLIPALEQLEQTVDPDTVDATTRDLQVAADLLMQLPARLAHRLDVMDRMSRGGDRMAAGLEDMQRITAYLRVFAINIKITAGGIAEAGAEFGEFAQEIRDRIELGHRQLDGFDAELAALRTIFRATIAQERALGVRYEALLPAIPNGLTSTAASMVEHQVRVAAAAVEVSVVARAIQKKVGAALGALQIGDITRQRIEHVSDALADLEAVPGLTVDRFERLERFVYGLVAAQLDSMGVNFQQDVEQIGEAMAGIADDAANLLRLRELALGGSDARQGGFLRQLEGHIAEALALVGEIVAAAAETRALGQSAVEASKGMAEQLVALQAMRLEVQHMALNANIKCSRIGQTGKPLAVIAVELRAHAGQMQSAADTAMSALEALASGAGQLTARVGDPRDKRPSEVVREKLGWAGERLRKAADAVESQLDSVARQGEEVVRALRSAGAGLDLQQEIGAVLDDAAEAFSELGKGEPFRVDDLAEPLAALLARMTKRYTMASERDIHSDYVTAFGLDTPAVAVAASASNLDLDAVLF